MYNHDVESCVHIYEFDKCTYPDLADELIDDEVSIDIPAAPRLSVAFGSYSPLQPYPFDLELLGGATFGPALRDSASDVAQRGQLWDYPFLRRDRRLS